MKSIQRVAGEMIIRNVLMISTIYFLGTNIQEPNLILKGFINFFAILSIWWIVLPFYDYFKERRPMK